MGNRIRVSGKNDGVNDNEAIDAQVDSTHNALHVKSHLYGYDGIGFTIPITANSDGSLIVNPSEATDMEGNGKVEVGTTAVAIPFTGKTQSIIISADTANTGQLYIGKSDVTNAGANAIVFLDAGDSVTIDYNDATNAIYVISDTATQNFWAGASL